MEFLATAIGLSRAILIFLLSRILGEALALIKLPSILGDLFAGIILGLSGLHLLVPPEAVETLNSGLVEFMQSLSGGTPEQIFAIYQKDIPSLETISELGLICLLFVTGLESDLQEMIRVGPQAATVATVGVIVPFALGTVGAIYLFDLPLSPALFAGAALTATSIVITAKVLQDLGKLKSEEGKIIIGASILDDILGIVILAVVVALVNTGNVEPSKIILLVISAAVFILSAVLLSKYFAPVFDALIDRLKVSGGLLVASFIFLCFMCLFAATLQLETVLGAFAAGIVLGGTKREHEIIRQIQPIVTLFATIFFVLIGTSIDLSLFNPLVPENREGLLFAVFLIVVAIFGKIVSGFTIFGKEQVDRLAIGAGMIPRGEVGLVFVGLGTATGVLSNSVEAALILMVIVTTFIAPLLLRVVFQASSKSQSQLQESKS
ncbi:MAG: cation:proton antiporter [Prochloraceae cyanobacterium]|nr:cation:proton antiporter [Prochloraceae cyanobacterium]